jgi:hypothetical protein
MPSGNGGPRALALGTSRSIGPLGDSRLAALVVPVWRFLEQAIRRSWVISSGRLVTDLGWNIRLKMNPCCPPYRRLQPQAAWWLPALKAVLTSERRRQSLYLVRREPRDGVAHADSAVGEAHQAGPSQLGHVEGRAEGAPAPGSGHEPQEIGHRPGAQHGRPIAADVRVIRGVAWPFQPARHQNRSHQRPASHGGPCGGRSAREWRGLHRDGRTSMSFHKCQSISLGPRRGAPGT